MKKSISMMAMAGIIVLFSTVAASAFGGGGGISAAMPPTPGPTEEIKELTLPLRLPSSKKVEQVPLFSEKHAQTLVIAEEH